jgi:hypothetical protein
MPPSTIVAMIKNATIACTMDFMVLFPLHDLSCMSGGGLRAAPLLFGGMVGDEFPTYATV